MERKIGETFEFEGKKLRVEESKSGSCGGCFFNGQCPLIVRKTAGECQAESRGDNKYVVFVEVQEQKQEEQPQKLNLCEILKNCPEGTKFYSYIFGEETYFQGVSLRKGEPRPIFIYGKYGKGQSFCLSRKGHPYADNYGECCIFPSKEMRDWSKFTAPWYKKDRFDPKTLKAFDRVIVYGKNEGWFCSIFSHIGEGEYQYNTASGNYAWCIPYNDDTKHLVGTKDEAPEYYRYWED